MQEFTLSQARHMAGIDYHDADFLRDIKFSSWLGDSKYRIVEPRALDTERQRAQAEGVEVLIIKD